MIMTKNTIHRKPRRSHYVAYGMNTSVSGMAQRCPAAERVAAGRIHDWRLVFRGVADIEPAPGDAVPVALWTITTTCLQSLDALEGYPSLYRREIIPVDLGDRTVEAIVYIMNDGGIRPPSGGYYDTIRNGYVSWGLPIVELDRAADAAREHCISHGAVRFVPDGPKRLMPVYADRYDDGEWDDLDYYVDADDTPDPEPCICESPGMSPATRMLFRKECGCYEGE